MHELHKEGKDGDLKEIAAEWFVLFALKSECMLTIISHASFPTISQQHQQ